MPYRPQEREYRSFAASNFKPVKREAEFDANGNDITPDEPTYKIRGYFCTFNDPYELYPRIGDWPAQYEQIDRHAFDSCNMTDVILQFDHAGQVLARIKNGSLKITFDDHGGLCEADLSGCQLARDLYESIQNGLITEMSFGFSIANDDKGVGYTEQRDEQGDYHVTITRIARLYDASIVSLAANPNTEVDEIRKRSYLYATIEADRKAEQEERAAQEQAAKDAEAAEKARISRMRRRAKALALQSI